MKRLIYEFNLPILLYFICMFFKGKNLYLTFFGMVNIWILSLLVVLFFNMVYIWYTHMCVCHCCSEIVILRILSVLVKIKTNNKKSKNCYFTFQTVYMLTCSTVVKFAYYMYVIIERHLNITRTP